MKKKLMSDLICPECKEKNISARDAEGLEVLNELAEKYTVAFLPCFSCCSASTTAEMRATQEQNARAYDEWNARRRPFYDNRVTDVATVEAFLEKYYKPERYHGRGEEYAATLLASHEADLEEHGYDIISRHDSVTGRVVAFYPEHAGEAA